ncbi:MAG: hypothetical protein ABI967_04390 [bacterium]
MQNPYTDFGERRTIYRASLGWLWWLVLCVAPLLLVTAVAAVFAIKSVTPGAFSCLGGAVLVLVLVGAACLSEFRKWYATRTVQLVIYEKGLTYESEGRRQSCSWDEIKDINFKRIEVKIKHSAPRKVSVIRSIVKGDGTLISFAETLNLEKFTLQIAEQRKGLVNAESVR